VREKRAPSSNLNNWWHARVCAYTPTTKGIAMTFQNDPNRVRPEPLTKRDPLRATPSTFVGSWGLPLGLAAIVIVAGLLFFNTGRDRTTTASNNSPTVTQTNPSSPAPSTPAPTPPVKTQ
jgi:hypothetical protein